MALRTLVTISCLAQFICACLAQDSAPKNTSSQAIQQQAEALMEKARRLSDIRAEGASAFVLKAAFSFVGDGLETVDGTYTETWASAGRWRRETAVGDSRYIEIADSDTRWLVYPDGFPRQSGQLPSLMAVVPSDDSQLNFTELRDGSGPGIAAECALTKPAVARSRLAFCFEKQTGVLLEKDAPEKRIRNLVNFSCEYAKFEKFGAYVFPREIVCYEDRHRIISAKVTDLAAAPSLDPAAFVAPEGAIEFTECTGKTVRPEYFRNGPAVFPDVVYPVRSLEHAAWAEIWFVVDTKGKPQDLRLVRSSARSSPESALKTVRGWRFMPGKCDGKAVPMPMTLEIPYTPK